MVRKLGGGGEGGDGRWSDIRDGDLNVLLIAVGGIRRRHGRPIVRGGRGAEVDRPGLGGGGVLGRDHETRGEISQGEARDRRVRRVAYDGCFAPP